MKLRIPVISTTVAVISGLVVIFFYFFPSPGNLSIRALLLEWAVILAAVTLLIGVVNLLSVHTEKMDAGGGKAVYSGVVIFSLLVTFTLALLLGPNDSWISWIFRHVQIPIETSLMAVLSVSLAYASTRILRRRPNVFSIIFFATVFLVLLGIGPVVTLQIPIISEPLGNFRAWIAQVPAAAGARGILLGVALGTVATGLRILMGGDRPYSG